MSNLSRIFIAILLSFAFSIDYLDEIQPIFNASCVSCHNSDSQNYSNHQLDLTSYSGLMNGGESGDVITPYDASLSILYQEVSSGNMPQYGSGEFLVVEQINLIADWINDGALEEEDESSSDPENWDCQYDSDCMEGEFCAVECFAGECGLDSSETSGTLGQYCQPCDECQYPEDAVSGNCDSCGTSNDGGNDDGGGDNDDSGGDDGPPDCMADCEGVEDVNPDVDANAFCEWYMDAYQNTDCLDTCEGEYNLMIEQLYFMCDLCLPTGDCDEMWDSEGCSGLDEYECDLNEDCIWDDFSMSCQECGCECLNSCGCEGNLDCEWNEETYTCVDSTTDGLPECWMDCQNIDVIGDDSTGTELCTWFVDTYNDENSCWDDCSDCGPEQNIYIQCETCLEMGEGMCDEWFNSSNECDELDEPDCESSEECTWNDYEMICEEYTDDNELEGECLDSDDCEDGLFCNMDHTSDEEVSSSFCEPCDYYSAIEDCYTDGLPEAGETECADVCFDDGGDLDNDLAVQDTYRIDNVYPNPFNPTTTVTYQIPEFSTISIDIYNMNGQLVENLYKGYKSPGKYSIEWTAENITSGAYLIKLVSGSFVETQKVMLVK